MGSARKLCFNTSYFLAASERAMVMSRGGGSIKKKKKMGKGFKEKEERGKGRPCLKL